MEIGKIANIAMTGNYSIKAKKAEQGVEKQTTNSSEIMNAQTAQALKAQLSFKGNIGDAQGIKTGYVENQPQIIATLNGENAIPDYMNFKYEGFEIKSATTTDGIREVSISKNGENIINAFINKESSDKIEFLTAKHQPCMVINDEIIMLKDSKAEKQGEYIIEYPSEKNHQPLHFTGNKLVASTLCKKDSVVNAIEHEQDKSATVPGQYTEEFKNSNTTCVILAGGFGTRFQNATDAQGKKTHIETCKPAFVLPNGQSIVGATFDLFKNAGMDADNLTYLEQNDGKNGPITPSLVSDRNEVIPMSAYGSDGGAVIKAVLDGNIPKDAPLLISNADTITNIDFSQVHHKMADLGNAALVIPSYPVSETRAKSFGLMSAGALAKDNECSELVGFNEKPKNPATQAIEAQIPGMTINGEQAYNGNPGIYLFGKEVLQNLDIVLAKANEIALTKAQAKAEAAGKPIPTELKDPFSSSTFLGNAFVPAVVQLCQEGELLNENNEPMKAYVAPMLTATGAQAYWDDIGTAEAMVTTCQKIAKETEENGEGPDNQFYGIRGLEDFMNSVTRSGVVFSSPEKREEYADSDIRIEGNVYVA